MYNHRQRSMRFPDITAELHSLSNYQIEVVEWIASAATTILDFSPEESQRFTVPSSFSAWQECMCVIILDILQARISVHGFDWSVQNIGQGSHLPKSCVPFCGLKNLTMIILLDYFRVCNVWHLPCITIHNVCICVCDVTWNNGQRLIERWGETSSQAVIWQIEFCIDHHFHQGSDPPLRHGLHRDWSTDKPLHTMEHTMSVRGHSDHDARVPERLGQCCPT